MPQKSTTQTEKEMIEAADIVRNFDQNEIRKLTKCLIPKNIKEADIFVFGMGSSLFFPGSNAKKRAAHLLPKTRIDIGPPNIYDTDNIPKNSIVLLLSNSGETIEIIDMAKKLKKKNITFFGITANNNSTLAKLCKEKLYILKGGFEKGVVATKSVIEQGLFLDSLIHILAKKGFPIVEKRNIRTTLIKQIISNFEKPIDTPILQNLTESETFYWIDQNWGVAKELAWKTPEMIGKKVYTSRALMCFMALVKP